VHIYFDYVSPSNSSQILPNFIFFLSLSRSKKSKTTTKGKSKQTKKAVRLKRTKQNENSTKISLSLFFVGQTTPGHGACPGVWFLGDYL